MAWVMNAKSLALENRGSATFMLLVTIAMCITLLVSCCKA